MKRKNISFVALLLSFSILFIHSSIVFANSETAIPTLDETEVTQLCKQLDFLYESNTELELLSMKTEYYLGVPIHSYEYVNETMEELNYLTYPIYQGDDIISLALEVELEGGETVMQVTECFVDEIAAFDSTKEGIALIYDKDSAYIATEDGIEKIATYKDTVDYRGIISDSSLELDIELNEVSILDSIESDSTQIQTYAGNLYTTSMSVPYVSQNPPSNICWAASTACIGNCLTGGTKTAYDIAVSVFGTTNWNCEASISVAMNALKNNYNVEYTVHQDWTAPTDVAIYANIYAGYPLYGRMENTQTSGHHLVVINGILENTYITIMDPEFGTATAWKSNGEYSYVSSYAGVTLKLMGYGSKG